MNLRRKIGRYEARQVRHNYGGVPLTVYLADELSEYYYDYDWLEFPEIVFLRRHKLKPGARVFELGAHQCVVALMLSNVVGPEGSVVAVEANLHNATVGQKNRDFNRAEQLQVLHAAVADRSGKVLFNEALNGQVTSGTSELGQVEVQAFSIDDLSQEYGVPDVLFIDVNGFECQVLQGARQTLNRAPDCCIKVHAGEGLEHFGGSVAQILSFFPETDYKLFVASEAELLTPEQSSSPDAKVKFTELTPGDNVLKSKFYLIAIDRKPGPS
jgi:FkbM family methyltransferase